MAYKFMVKHNEPAPFSLIVSEWPNAAVKNRRKLLFWGQVVELTRNDYTSNVVGSLVTLLTTGEYPGMPELRNYIVPIEGKGITFPDPKLLTECLAETTQISFRLTRLALRDLVISAAFDSRMVMDMFQAPDNLDSE